jgi:hypothetical protein
LEPIVPLRQRVGCAPSSSPCGSQIYSGALYVEEDKCAKELGVRARGGFFANDADFCTAMLDAACHKVLIVSARQGAGRGGRRGGGLLCGNLEHTSSIARIRTPGSSNIPGLHRALPTAHPDAGTHSWWSVLRAPLFCTD